METAGAVFPEILNVNTDIVGPFDLHALHAECVSRVQEVSRSYALSPKDSLNFLKDWKDGSYPDGWANKPATWVSLEDACEDAK